MSELIPAQRDGLEIEFLCDVEGRAQKGARQMVSSSMARDFVDRGVAKYTGVGMHFQYREHLSKGEQS